MVSHPSIVPVSAPSAGLTVPIGLARRVIDAITAYDVMRVRTYQARPGNPNRIEVRSFGSATAFRFPAVGYFNAVYQFREEDLPHLEAISEFFAEAGRGFKLMVAPDTRRDVVFAHLAAAGFQVSERLTRLVLPVLDSAFPLPPAGVSFARVEPHERELFFRLYLQQFGADPATHDAALENMRLLHDEPALRCLFARFEGNPAGLCMLFQHQGTALLCAGATLPEWRRLGIQSAMIAQRLWLGARAGCDIAVSWTDADSQSQSNLEGCGFQAAYLDPVWHRPARGA